MKKLSLPFSLLQAVYWAMSAVAVAFMVPMLRLKGFGESEIGVAMAITAVAAMIAQPLWGALCDRLNRMKPILLLGCGVSGLIYWLILKTDSPLAVVALSAAIGATIQSLQTVTDSWSTKLSYAGYRLNYGFTRSMGSLAYAVTSLLFGAVVAKMGLRISPLVLLALALFMFLIVLRLPDPPAPEQEHPFSIRDAIRSLGGNAPFLVLVLCFFLVTVTSTSFITFYPVFLNELGGNEGHLGLAYFVMAASEIPTMSNYNRLERRFGTMPLLVFSMVGHGLRSIAVGLAGSAPLAIALMFTQIIGWAIALPAYMSYIGQVVDRRYLSTAVLVSFALGMSLGQIVGNAAAGYIAEGIGIAGMMFITSAFAFLAAAIMIVYGLVRKPLKTQSSKEES